MILDILNIGGKIIDKIFPDANAAESAKLKLLELQQNGQLAQINADIAEQQELTKRHTSDMTSDSWLSKNIRPVALIALVTGYFVFATGSAFGVHVTEAYVELLGQWGMLAFSFYFGSRGMEKIAQVWASTKNKEIENGSK
jgi:Holin of 3TMs, for gene-transfer release